MKSTEILDEGFEDALAVLNLPVAIRKRLRTSNGIERLNEEIRRRERVIRIFPNTDSLYRLIGVLLIEIYDAWQSGRKYMDLSFDSSAIPDSQTELVEINQRDVMTEANNFFKAAALRRHLFQIIFGLLGQYNEVMWSTYVDPYLFFKRQVRNYASFLFRS